MRILPTTFLVLALLVQVAFALHITTADGQSYKQCAVTRVEPDALRITHADGAARIPYEKLPPALQKQYFDPAKVAAYRNQAEDARKAAAAKAAEQQRLRNEAATKAAQAERDRIAEQTRQESERRETQERKERERRTEEERQKAFQATMRVVAITVGIVVGLFLYFIPSIVGRHKRNAGAIFVMNLFLGWLFIGWVIALIWACTKDSSMERLADQRLNYPPRGGRGPYLE
jgi:hypothetical protein